MLAGLLSKQDKELDRSAAAAPAQKRQRLEEGMDIFQALAQALHEMRRDAIARNVDPTKLEVEMRVGMLVDRDRRWKAHQASGGALVTNDKTIAFQSGIDKLIADRLKGILTTEGYRETVLKPERLRFNETGDIRRVVDDAGNLSGKAEAKDKFDRRNIACLGHNYDIRLDFASETPVDMSSASSAASEAGIVWHMERLKRRTRYTMPGRGWQVDLTDVDTTKLTGPGASRVAKPTIELEFELVPAALASWLNCAEGDVFTATSKIATELLHVFNLCVPSGATESTHSGISATVSLTPDVVSAMAAITSRIRRENSFGGGGGGSGRGLDFMGCMPLNISRKNLKALQKDPYFVTEKSDGVRYLLFVLPAAAVPSVAASAGAGADGAVAVLMDRSPKLYLPVGAAETGRALGVGTALDGEIVMNLATKQSVFLVFDVLALDGTPCSQRPFEERLTCLQGPVSERIASLSVHQQQPAQQQPLRLVEKRFVPKAELRSLLGKMAVKDGHRVYQDRENKWRCHKSDGLIFQPNLPYLFATDVNLIKWKWPELTSIDLNAILVNEPGDIGGVGLLALGNDGSMVDCTKRGRSRVGLGDFDTLRIRADIEDSLSSTCIAEVAYCPQVGLWTYFHMRPDKSSPNHINTALSILMEQAEAISIEELEYCLLARNETENDFSKQLAKMTTKALEFQRSRCGASSASSSSSAPPQPR
jgi:hypothetical protein